MENHSNIRSQFVSHKIASELKKLGFNEECLAHFDTTSYQDLIHNCENVMEGDFVVESVENSLKAPLWQQAIDWLREKQNVFACPIFDQISGKGYWCTFGIMGKSCSGEWDFETYEDAREYAILKAIELCKK